MKKLFVYSAILLAVLNTKAQTVFIPDANFLNALITKGVDKNKDNQIQVSEAVSIKELEVANFQIYDLTGIEAFTSVTYLNCGSNGLAYLDLSDNIELETLEGAGSRLVKVNLSKNKKLKKVNLYSNQITSLDISQNKLLDYLDLAGNKLTALDVSQNPLLTYLSIYNNQVLTFDVSKNTALTHLYTAYNQLSVLDVSSNKALEHLGCDDNQLSALDISTNSAIVDLICRNNVSLDKICINNSHLIWTYAWIKDPNSQWSTSCNGVTGIDDKDILSPAKTVSKVYNMLGQLVLPENAINGIFIFQYNDGSIQKLMKHQ